MKAYQKQFYGDWIQGVALTWGGNPNDRNKYVYTQHTIGNKEYLSTYLTYSMYKALLKYANSYLFQNWECWDIIYYTPLHKIVGYNKKVQGTR